MNVRRAPILSRVHRNSLGHDISKARPTLAMLATTMALLAACGGSPPDPAALLRQAKQAVDGASAAHFQLTSTGAVGSGTVLIGGEGDIKRPDGFQGTLRVSAAGFDVDVPVASVGGTFYARDPLTGRWTKTSPAAYGFGDPAQLMSPQHGLSSLLPLCMSPTLKGDDLYSGDLLHEVGCALPGHAVAALLTSADASQPVDATFGIDGSTGQLRRVVLSGPFYSTTSSSTFTLVVVKYGENVSITPPPASS